MRLKGTSEVIDGTEYPVTTEELIDDHGEREIELPNGTETLAECLDRLEPETYDSPEEVRLSVFTAVSGEAVGRRHYTDRDPTTLGSPFGHEQVSF
jgi:hypothetical protein